MVEGAGKDVVERQRDEHTQRFARQLDGRWVTMGIDSSDPRYAVWLFHGPKGHREAKGSFESFTAEWLDELRVRLVWFNGDEEIVEYEFVVANDLTRQVALCTRGRGVFAFETAPLVYVNYH